MSMGLADILDITETQVPNAQGELQRTFRVSFTTEETSGAKTIQIPADEFTPDRAREQAEQEAEAIDAALTNPAEE